MLSLLETTQRPILIAMAVIVGSLWGCTTETNIRNAAPVVTAVAPVTLLDSDQVQLFVWIRDHEEDPVDITVFLVDDAGVEMELDIVGGHLTHGLTTSKAPTGQAHELIWQPEEVPNEAIRIRIQIIDWNGAEGSDFTSEPFVLSDGLPAP